MTHNEPPIVLVVDPDADVRATYLASLELSGCVVDGVADGREALAKAISYRPTIVVTETRVPCLDGFELCRLLKLDPDTQHIPILVLTADVEETHTALATAAGADRVVLKPCLPADLTREVQAMIATAARHRKSSSEAQPRIAAARSTSGGRSRSRLHQRGETTQPPASPPKLLCPTCDRPLAYQCSHVGGVSATHSEQWDDYECSAGCGRFQYRQRTRKLRSQS